MLQQSMIRRNKKNFLVQRWDFYIEHKNDLYNILFKFDQMEIDITQALKLSVGEEDVIEIVEYQQKRKKSLPKNNAKLVVQEIDKYLKAAYSTDSYSLQTKQMLQDQIMKGNLSEMNHNWAIFELSGARAARRQNQGVYAQYLEMKPRYPCDYFETIKLGEKNELKLQKQSKIQDILEAYAIRNPYVGYCQGLNFIVNFIIEHLRFDQEDGFWVYASLIENVMPLDYYTSVVGAMVDQKILEFYIEQYLPNLSRHFKTIGLQINFFTLQWFICIFTSSLSPLIVKEILLRLLVLGIRALIISSLVLLIILETSLMAFEQFTDCVVFINDFVSKYEDVEEFRFYSNQITMDERSFDFAREQLRKQLLSKSEVQLTEKNIREVNDMVECPLQQPICNKVQALNLFLRRSFSYFVLTSEKDIHIIDNYWENKVAESTAQNQNFEPLFGKHKHICREPKQKESSPLLSRSIQLECFGQYSSPNRRSKSVDILDLETEL